MAHEAFLALCATGVPPLKVVVGALSMLQWRKVEEDHGVASFRASIFTRSRAEQQEPAVQQVMDPDARKTLTSDLSSLG